MLSKHYAPSTPTFLVDNVRAFVSPISGKNIGLLVFNKKLDYPHIKHQFVLSKNSDLKEATSNLYSALHELDKLKLEMIVCEKLPDYGLGKSINDRLVRATKQD